MTKAEIAKISGITRQWVYDILDWLESIELIEFVAKRRGEYMYYLRCLEEVESKNSVKSANSELL